MHTLHRLAVTLTAAAALTALAAAAPAASASGAPTAARDAVATAVPAVTSAPPASSVSSAASASTAGHAAASVVAAAVTAVDSASVPCSSTRQLGDKKVVSDLGTSAFTVRQFIGWCTDSRGQAWMNFSSVYVWDQYHARGFAYRSYAGVAVRGELEPRGFVASANRQQLSYSAPVRTTAYCTQGWGKLYRSGSESAQGLTTLVC